MKISLVVAASDNHAIGKDNQLLWHLPKDMRFFKNTTWALPILMGRKTFESIGKPLPNRRNIIITRNENYEVDGCEIVSSLEEAFLLTNNDCFIIGGGEIYKQSIEVADKIYLTLVDCEVNGDTFFPDIDSTWKKISRKDFESDEKNEYRYSFIEYEKYQF